MSPSARASPSAAAARRRGARWNKPRSRGSSGVHFSAGAARTAAAAAAETAGPAVSSSRSHSSHGSQGSNAAAAASASSPGRAGAGGDAVQALRRVHARVAGSLKPPATISPTTSPPSITARAAAETARAAASGPGRSSPFSSTPPAGAREISRRRRERGVRAAPRGDGGLRSEQRTRRVAYVLYASLEPVLRGDALGVALERLEVRRRGGARRRSEHRRDETRGERLSLVLGDVLERGERGEREARRRVRRAISRRLRVVRGGRLRSLHPQVRRLGGSALAPRGVVAQRRERGERRRAQAGNRRREELVDRRRRQALDEARGGRPRPRPPRAQPPGRRRR